MLLTGSTLYVKCYDLLKFLKEAEDRKRCFWASTGMAVRASKGDDLKPEIFVLRGFKALPRVEFQPL